MTEIPTTPTTNPTLADALAAHARAVVEYREAYLDLMVAPPERMRAARERYQVAREAVLKATSELATLRREGQ